MSSLILFHLLLFIPLVFSANQTRPTSQINPEAFLKYLIGHGIKDVTFFSHTLEFRNLTLTTSLVGEIFRTFTFRPRQIVHDNQYQHNLIPSRINTLYHFNIFCCNCMQFSLNCPVCVLQEMHICEVPFRDFSPLLDAWFTSVYLPFYTTADTFATPVRSHRLSTDTFYSFKLSHTVDHAALFASLLVAPNNKCHRTRVSMKLLPPFDPTTCMQVVPHGKKCPSYPTGLTQRCDWQHSTRNTSLDEDNKICTSLMYNNSYIYFFKSGRDGLCSVESTDVVIPSLIEFARLIVDGTTDRFYPRYVTYVDGEYKFIMDDFRSLNIMLQKLQSGDPITSLVSLSQFTQKIICEYVEALHDNNSIYNGKPSWLGEILVQKPCEEFFPFNSTHMACDAALFSTAPYCARLTFRSLDVLPHRFSIPKKITLKDQLTCSQLNDTGVCTYSSVFSSIFSDAVDRLLVGLNSTLVIRNNTDWDLLDFFFRLNSTLSSTIDRLLAGLSSRNTTNEFGWDMNTFFVALNETFSGSIREFLDALGRNTTTKPQREKGKLYLVGNWISDIFGILIAPFFDAFVDIVLSAFLPPLFNAFTSVISQLSKLITGLVHELSKFTVVLATALTDIFLSLLHLLLGIITVIESRILLFEYVILFILINKKFLNNVYVSASIVLIALLVFGFERHSPSFLITFLHPHFHVFNLTHYYSTNFSYNYTFSFRPHPSSN